MSSRQRLEGPVSWGRGPTREAKRAIEAARDAEFRRAQERYLIAKMVALVAPTASLPRQQEVARSLLEAGLITRLPSTETIRVLVQRWHGGARSIQDYVDRPRQGRAPGALDARLLEALRTCIRTRRPAAFRRIYVQLKKLAAEMDVPMPSRGKLHDLWRREQTHLSRSAGRHGAAAAEMDGLPHSTVPATATHDIWTLDEFTLPVWCRMIDTAEQRWVSFKPDVVVIEDYKSRAVLAAWVADPSRRVDRAGKQKRSGTDISDVLGALLSAAIPELASAACRPYAGYLARVIRWDRALHHEALRDPLEKVGVAVPKLPGGRPINRGIVERLIRTLKSRCDTLVGHVEHYLPSDRATTELRDEQDQISATGGRVCMRMRVEPEFLPTIDEVRVMFDAIVREYNEEHEHESLGGRTPGLVYREAFPREPRRGQDLLAVLPTKITTVTGEHIVHRADKQRVRFACEAKGVMLTRGTRVEYRADPLLRMIFAETAAGPVALPRLEAWAAEQDPEEIAKHQRGIARAAAEAAEAAQRAATAQALGEVLLARGEAAMVETSAHDDDGQADDLTADAGGTTRADERPTPTSDNTETDATPSVTDFDSLIKMTGEDSNSHSAAEATRE